MLQEPGSQGKQQTCRAPLVKRIEAGTDGQTDLASIFSKYEGSRLNYAESFSSIETYRHTVIYFDNCVLVLVLLIIMILHQLRLNLSGITSQ